MPKINSKKLRRSIAQNKYLWGVVNAHILGYFKVHMQKFFEYLLITGLTAEFIHEWIKLRYKVRSTTRLTTEEFCELVYQIRHDMYHDLGLHIPEPNEGELMQAYEEHLKIRGQ